MKTLFISAVAALAVSAIALPSQALDLGGGKDRSSSRDSSHERSGKSRSGLSVSVDRGGVSVGVGGTSANVSVGSGGTEADIDVLGRKGLLKGSVTSGLAGGVNAQLEALSTRNLAKVCADVGGGDACGSGNRSELLGLIQTRLDVLPPGTIANLCLSAGGDGCGSARGPGGGDDAGPGPGDIPDAIGNLSDNERAVMKKRCIDVLNTPKRYDAGLYQLCRLLAQI